MTTWLAQEITDRIVDAAAKYQPSNPQQLKQLHTALCHAAPRETYFGIMGVFLIPRFGPQEIAGRLLLGIKPRPREPLADILRRVLNTWDVSIEQLPWYLAEKFGSQELLEALEEIEKESGRTERELSAIRTFHFWLPKFRHVAQPTVPPDAPAAASRRQDRG